MVEPLFTTLPKVRGYGAEERLQSDFEEDRTSYRSSSIVFLPREDRATERSRLISHGAPLVARYFFHILNGEFVSDEVGSEHLDMDAVRQEAIMSAGQMLSDGDQSWSGEAWQMVVTNEVGAIVYGLRFSADRHGL